jgi:glutaredoxin
MATKAATLYRMVTPEHVCPSGLKALDLLRQQGFKVDDRPLTTREATDRFKAEHNVATTPQTVIGDDWVGGYEALRNHLGLKTQDPAKASYAPVIAVFIVAAAVAMAASDAAYETVVTMQAAKWFIAVSMCILAVLKFQNLDGFATTFLGYDLLAQRWPTYARLYPFGEALAGVLMVAGALTWLSAPLALFIGGVGAVSVFKAVYLDKRDLKCACVGGASNVPLGFVSLTENVMMVAMALWMLFVRA